MNDITLHSCAPHVLLSHLALYGLAAILESEGASGLRVGWTASADPRPYVTAPEMDHSMVGTAISRHARAASATTSWLHRDVLLNGTTRAVMSPRLSRFGDYETWRHVQRHRHEVLDELSTSQSWLDLRFIASLGEPCYWSRDRKGEIQQDNGASRLEMQPRNQGSEFVTARLRKLAKFVARRDPGQIITGLRGETVRDEAEKDKPDSRTATGFAGPGPTDNALAWCAMWGISQFSLALRVNKAATSGHLSDNRKEWFYAPIWRGTWRSARLRTILASAEARVAASPGGGRYSDAEIAAARGWLAVRGVDGLIRFPIRRFGTDKAAEWRAMRGEPLPMRTPHD